MNNQKQALTEQDVTELRSVMNAFVSDLGKLNQAKPHPKWVTWMDNGLEVGEWR
jgi:hypothetical protein